MAPKFLTDGFDQLSDIALTKMGLEPEFIADFDQWEALKKVVDFTKVDRDAAQNLLNSAGQYLSKKAFETAADAVNKGLTVVAGVLGATGQWYGTAAALVGEEVLDLAESYFESYMGWDKEEEFFKGEWVIIDKGRRRRLGEAEFVPVSSEEQELAALHGRRLPDQKSLPNEHEKHLGVISNGQADSDGLLNTFDTQTGTRDWVSRGALFGLNKEKQLEYDNREDLLPFKAMAFHKNTGFRDEVANKASARIGDHVYLDDQPFTVSKGSKHIENAYLISPEPGQKLEVPWGSPRLKTDGYVTSTFVPYDGDNPNQGFVQAGREYEGEFFWEIRDNHYVLVVALYYNRELQEASVANCKSGERYDVPINLLSPYKGASKLPKVFGNFYDACMKTGDEADRKRRSNIPGNYHPEMVTRVLGAELDIKFMPQHKQGKPESRPSRPLQDGPDYVATPELARALEQNRQENALKGKRDGERWNVVPYRYSDLGEDWGEPEVPLEKGGAGNFMMPVLALGAMAAFVLSR